MEPNKGQIRKGRAPRCVAAGLIGAGLLIAGLAGCSGVRDTLGLNKKAPDEFAVVTKAPLTLPPDYALRPPEPGAPALKESQPRVTAEAALTGQSAPQAPRAVAGRDPGESALLQRAGAADVNPNIRQVVNSEFTQLAERDKSFTDRLLFWQKPAEPGVVVDPKKESERLRQNAATGQPVTTGDTPIIQRKQRGWLEGIF
ncbi:MAG TPA: DUF3035 domain-containing protein [Candidatus Cybelea sp.]|nr:DUF3035 domain-containing protein [Candidatus Cybelea sp.]